MTEPDTLEFSKSTLDFLFPMHVLIDAHGHIQAVGPTMSLIIGDPADRPYFFDVFRVDRPRNIQTITDIHALGGKPLTVALRDTNTASLEFRCAGCAIGEAGQTLIDCALGSNMLEAIERFQLKAKHFRPNDFSVDLFYSFETQRTLLEDSQTLAMKLSQAKEAAELAASIDPVTGIGSRLAFQTKLQNLTSSPVDTVEHALLQIDLDRFKLINDTFGHVVGDRVLRNSAQAIAAFPADNAFAARLGGDEFVLLIENPPPDDALFDQASSLVADISRPVKVNEQSCEIGASIGITRFYPANTQSTEQPLLEADVALYAAKYEGKDVVIVTPQMMEEHARRGDATRDIEAGIANGEFIPFFQPQINLATGHIIGAEVLGRWHHRTRGILSPAHWLEDAERAGLMYAIDQSIIKTAIGMLKTWRETGHQIGKLSINLTSANLRSDDFLEGFNDDLMNAGIPNQCIQFELLESILLDQKDRQLIKRCEALEATGFKLALDDFGTGHASIATLIEAPISLLKIDRSFVMGLDQNPKLQRITRAIMAMSDQIGLEVIAEGVETQAELDLVTSYGCQNVQGYYFAAPMNEKDFLEWNSPLRNKAVS